MSGCASRSASTQEKSRSSRRRTRKLCGSMWPSAWRAAAPADPAAFGPPSGFFSRQTRKSGFAVALAAHLLPGEILTLYLQFVRSHRGLGQKSTRKYIQKLSAFAQYLEDGGVTQLSCITPGHVR